MTHKAGLQAKQAMAESMEKAFYMGFGFRGNNPDEWRSKYQAAIGNASQHITRLNQVWEIDSTPTDIMLSDGKRHNIVGIIDVYSRRAIMHISRTSTSEAVAACLRQALLTWGVPEVLVAV